MIILNLLNSIKIEEITHYTVSVTNGKILPSKTYSTTIPYDLLDDPIDLCNY